MLSTMREKTKVVMVILAVAFVAWLVFDVGMGISGRGQTQTQDVGSVNGTPIRYQTYMDAYRNAYDGYRAQNPGMSFTREEVRDIENSAFNSLVQQVLLREEYRKRGIVVTDREIVDAVRRAPPPEILRSPEFQTNGQFDPAKYERFLSSQNVQTREYLLAMEARYREELPRYKLLQGVTSDVYVSDAKLWQIWRDTRDSLVVRALIVRPEAMRDSAAPTEAEMRAWYNAHKDDFRQPARAKISFVAIPKLPTAADSVMLVQHVREVRDSLNRGADFAEIARTESSDTASSANGGSLGTFGKGQMDATFERAAWSQPLNTVGDPVITTFGIHLIKVEKRTADSVTARHILFPYARIGARLDTLEAQADSLDRLAADKQTPSSLDSAAQIMSLIVQHPQMIYQDVPYMLGRFRIPDVGVWAFEANPGETSPVVETRGAYYVFRLDSSYAAGTPRYEDVQQQVALAVSRSRKRAAAQAMAQDVERRLAAGGTFDQLSSSLGLSVVTLGPLTRTANWPLLGSGSGAVGAAFRLRAGERSGLMENDEAFFFLQAVRRVDADSARWAAQKEEQRAQIIRAARQVRVQSYLASLQRAAKIKDRRAEVLRPQPGQPTDN